MRRNILLVFVITLVIALFFEFEASAAVVTANSCSNTDVQQAVTQVINGGGGQVNIPAGICTWTSRVTVDTGVGKNIHIIGAGQGITIITDFRLQHAGSGSNIVELAHMTILSSALNGEIFFGKFRPADNAGSKFLNYHNLTITGRGPIGTLEGWIGVVHNNTFNCRAGQYGWYVHGYGNYASTIPAMGTSNSIFFENNTFNGCYHAISGFCNSKIVFRYNTIKNSTHCVDVHGPGYNGCYYSTPQWGLDGGRLFEHYNNTYESSNACGARIRSGSGISTGNTYQFTSDGWWSYFGINNDKTCTGFNHILNPWNSTQTGAVQGIQEFWVWNETCPVTNWGNSELSSGCFNVANNSCVGGIRENIEYFLRAPQAGDAVTSWTPYTYPHPLSVGIDPPPIPTPLSPTIIGVQPE